MLASPALRPAHHFKFSVHEIERRMALQRRLLIDLGARQALNAIGENYCGILNRAFAWVGILPILWFPLAADATHGKNRIYPRFHLLPLNLHGKDLELLAITFHLYSQLIGTEVYCPLGESVGAIMEVARA